MYVSVFCRLPLPNQSGGGRQVIPEEHIQSLSGISTISPGICFSLGAYFWACRHTPWPPAYNLHCATGNCLRLYIVFWGLNKIFSQDSPIPANPHLQTPAYEAYNREDHSKLKFMPPPAGGVGGVQHSVYQYLTGALFRRRARKR